MRQIYGRSVTMAVIDEFATLDDLDTNIDIDIWGYGRDAAAAGRYTLRGLKAHYHFIEFEDNNGPIKMIRHLDQYFPTSEYDQQPFWVYQKYIFFQTKEQRDLAHALQYIVMN